jgi:hypothetical protein
MRRLGVLLAVAVSLGACTPDPEGTRLGLPTEALQVMPGPCTFGAIPPFRIGRDGGDMVFEDIETGERRSITWPFGFAAWLEYGIAVLYATDGNVVGQEGDVLENIGAVDLGGGYRVCAVGVRNY